MQRYCIRATVSWEAQPSFTSLDEEALDSSTTAQETRSEQPAWGTATERYATAPATRRSAAAAQQEADNSAADPASRAQDTIKRTSSKLFPYKKDGKE